MGGKYLNKLTFADDIALMANSKEEILEMIEELRDVSSQVGLKINEAKTKIISNTPDDEYKIGDWTVEKVEDYTYLGQVMSFKEKMKKEIDARVSAAWRSFFGLKKFLLSPLPLFHKRKLMDSVVLSTLTYGAQTWSMSASDEKRLSCEQRSMERRMMKISLLEHQTNVAIRYKSKIKDVIEKCRELKWDWCGHVTRMQEDKWAYQAMSWIPIGKRRRGHQQKRWRDDIEEIALGRWKEKARDRVLWKKLRTSYVHKDT